MTDRKEYMKEFMRRKRRREREEREKPDENEQQRLLDEIDAF